MLSDTITPISVFLNLRDVYKSVSLFESSDYNSKENSKSFICIKSIGLSNSSYLLASLSFYI